MAQLKCTECGKVFDYELDECPNCGCPSGECNTVGEKVNGAHCVKNEIPTTDTGSGNEKAITNYANGILSTAIICGVLIYIASLFVAFDAHPGFGFLILFVGGFILYLYIKWVYLMTAFLRVYANISTNLHEINMKL